MLRLKRPLVTALRCAAVGGAALLCFRVFSAADGQRVQALISRVGLLGLGLVVLPQLVAISVESYAWKLAFEVGGWRPRWRALLRVRLATEALAQSLPVGVAFAESIKPVLLARHAGLAVEASIAGMSARKVLLLAAQCLYVVALTLLGYAGLEAVSERVLGLPHLGAISLATGLVLGFAGLTAALLLRQSRIASDSFTLLSRLPHAPLVKWLAERERRFRATDGAVSAFFRGAPRRLAAPLLAFTTAWFVEALETWLILSVLGADVSFATAGSIEVVVSLVRNIVFVVPAGLGVQDLGYAACFGGFALPDAASLGAAFMLLKRGKELLWIGVGYGLLGGDLGALLGQPAARERRVPRLLPAGLIGDLHP